MKNSILLITFISLFFSIASSSKEQLSASERNITNQVKQDLIFAVDSLETAVNLNSGTMNFEGIKKVADHFQRELKDIGFLTDWLDGFSFNRAGHLVASYGNNLNNLNILLIGHLDTVFAKGDTFQKFVRVDQKHVAGPGITDMKGGDVIMIAALRTLKKLNLLDDVNIKIVMTGDEESSGRPLSDSKKAIIDAAKWADIALGFEDGDGDINTAVISRRGASSWQLEVSGKPAHSSQIFRDDIGYGAIYETARILNQFRESLSSQKHLTFNPGLIVGGTRIEHQQKSYSATTFGKNNVIAKDVKVTGDIRALSPLQLSNAKLKMQQIVAESLSHTNAKITFSTGYPPMAPTKGNKALLTLYSQISQDLGYNEVTAVNPSRAGAADISFAAGHVAMAIDGLGLMGTGGHTKDEVANIRSLEMNINKAAILIHRLSREKGHTTIVTE